MSYRPRDVSFQNINDENNSVFMFDEMFLIVCKW